jgi:hypothetical protein
MTDEEKEDITKIAIAMVIDTFKPHGYLPAALDLNVIGYADDGTDVISLIADLYPVSCIHEQDPEQVLRCAGTLRINHNDESVKLHLVTEGEFKAA